MYQVVECVIYLFINYEMTMSEIPIEKTQVIEIKRSQNNREGVELLIKIELRFKDDIEHIKRKIERGEVKLILE